MFTREWFFDLDRRLRDAGLDSDRSTFDEILKNLQPAAAKAMAGKESRLLTPDEFAHECIYVILASGFSQKTAKRKHTEIMEYIKKAGKNPILEELLKIFNNKNKMNAIIKIWNNRERYQNDYYSIKKNHKSEIINQKLTFLSTLPHIGKITANHLARNLGENVVKYDIWIQRLGVCFANKFSNCNVQSSNIDNGKLCPEIKSACDEMFAHLSRETNLPIGYIDVVLWKASQNNLIPLLRSGVGAVLRDGEGS